MSSPLKRINLFNSTQEPLKSIDNLPHPKKKIYKEPKRKSLPTNESIIPIPANNSQYTHKEVCSILSS